MQPSTCGSRAFHRTFCPQLIVEWRPKRAGRWVATIAPAVRVFARRRAPCGARSVHVPTATDGERSNRVERGAERRETPCAPVERARTRPSRQD
eukprot:14232613-Alexandrium_andersonii.AAC.1